MGEASDSGFDLVSWFSQKNGSGEKDFAASFFYVN